MVVRNQRIRQMLTEGNYRDGNNHTPLAATAAGGHSPPKSVRFNSLHEM